MYFDRWLTLDNRQSKVLANRYPRALAPRKEIISKSANSISPKVACGVLLPLDIAILMICGTLTYAIWLVDAPYALWTEYGLIMGFGSLLAVNVFSFAGMYEPAILHKPGTTIRRLLTCWLGVAALLVTVGFLTKTSEDYSRLWAIMWFISSLATLALARWLFYTRVARWIAQGRLSQNIAIIGSGQTSERLVNHFETNPATGIRVAGVYNDRKTQGANAKGWQGDRFYDGTIDDLIDDIRYGSIDTVIVAPAKLDERRLHRLFTRLKEVSVDVRLCPGRMALQLINQGCSEYAGVPTINVFDRPFVDWRNTVKEVEDRIFASIILLLISPVMLTIAALIKLDSPGPVFFRQKRLGYNNRFFDILKFRTMRQEDEDPWGSTLTQRDDPRVTPIGRILRRWSLDELPQFINVLRGEMSIVGPRPHALSAKAGDCLYKEAVPFYDARHRVKPGITGWAQINGWRGPTDTVRQIQKRVEHDLYYIEHWSLGLDLRIILLTVLKGFGGRNAF